ncbi:AI-2E family transporter [Agromyces arachidis]|uniref:AI-2E family transporter n=1 Tax=Agromyces arachidis TaxID=766966 RepID=UPI004056C323
MTDDPRPASPEPTPALPETTPALPEPTPHRADPLQSMATHPSVWGFRVALGLLGAALLALIFINLSDVMLSVFVAAFVALGLDPLIRWFERRGMRRGTAIVTVLILFIVVVVGIIWILVPPVVEQATALITGLPGQIEALVQSGWFEQFNETTNGIAAAVAAGLGDLLSDPNTWATIGGGALAFGVSILNAVSTGFFVVVLSIYFIATLDSSKQAIYTLVPASERPVVVPLAERIMQSIGKYLSGMVVLAFLNATYSTILLVLTGNPYALILGVVALFVTLIPLIGTVLTTILMTFVSLFVSPTAAAIVLVAMLIYMQVEAYVLTPRVMGKAVQVPGAIVLISALAGGTLLGLLGALVAIPISAGILLILREIVVPRQAVS